MNLEVQVENTLETSISELRRLQAGMTENERRKRNKARSRLRLKNQRRMAICHPDRVLFAKDLCAACYREQCSLSTKEFYAAQGRKRFRKRLYGVSDEDFQAKLKEQDYRCAICREVSSQTLCLDHDHETGKLRQLLCQDCNRGLGMFSENPERLRAAADYLEKHQNAQTSSL